MVDAGDGVAEPAISPDGRHVAYRTGSEIWVQDLDRDEARKVVVDDGISALCWSPGSDSIAFLKWNVVLKRVSVQGGPVLTLWELPEGAADKPAWSSDGKSVVFGRGFPSRLYQVPAEGGSPKPLFVVGTSESSHTFQAASFLPDRNGAPRLLMVTGSPDATRIAARDLQTGRLEVLGTGERPVYSPSGHVVYQSAGDLWAMPFSLESLKKTGEPFRVQRGGAYPSVASDGTLVYLGTTGGLQQLIWRDRRGTKLSTIGQPQRRILGPRLSPVGSRVAVTGSDDGVQFDLWISDVLRGTKSRFNSHPALESNPIWTPGGDELTFTSDRNGTADIFRQSGDASREPSVLVATNDNEFAGAWTKDLKYLIYGSCSRGQCDIWYLERKGEQGAYEALPFIRSPFDDWSPTFSPDGRFVIYTSNESGRNEVYVQRFPDAAGKVQVSTNGGTQPRWSRDGRELFYVEEDTLMAVPVDTAAGFSLGAAARLFQDRDGFSRGRGLHWDVSADGKRFVLVETLQKSTLSIRIVQNWFAEFREREPIRRGAQ
jgi:Tol biopolymer transport system component